MKKQIRKKHKPEESWKPVALAVIFTIVGFVNILLAFTGTIPFYGYDLGEIGIALGLVFGAVFIGVAWSFYKRKEQAITWGYGTAILNLIFNLILFNLVGLILWAFVLYLVHSSKEELIN